MSERSGMLAKIHIARKDLGLDEATYRSALLRTTGQDSALACTDRQLETALQEFRRLGWRPKRRAPLSSKPYVRMIYGLWKEMAPQLGGGGSRESLRAFVRRQTTSEAVPDGVSAPEFLDAQQAARVIEGLKAWRARLLRS